MRRSRQKPVWPEALHSGKNANVLEWVFETWESHAAEDDRSLRRQYVMRAAMLREVETAIRQCHRTPEELEDYRRRLEQDLCGGHGRNRK